MSRGHAAGIDLRSTNSVVSHGNVATASVLTRAGEERTLPSAVAFDAEEADVGRRALDRAVEATLREGAVGAGRASGVASGRDATLTVESAFHRTTAAIRSARAELPHPLPSE